MGSSVLVCEKGAILGSLSRVHLLYFLLFCASSVEGDGCFLSGSTGLDLGEASQSLYPGIGQKCSGGHHGKSEPSGQLRGCRGCLLILGLFWLLCCL